MNKDYEMYRIRKALARMVFLLMIPTIIYILAQLGDTSYCPSIG